MRRVLIDTNIYIEAMHGNSTVTTKLQKVDLIGVSSISMGELLAGFKLKKRFEKQLSQFEEFLDSPRVELFPVDHNTADYYSEVYIRLRKAGKPIPTNDIWIAATALENGLTIFTLDKHFHSVAGLKFY